VIQRLPEDTTTRIQLKGPYADFWLDIYDDPEMGVFEDILSGELARLFRGMATVTKDSNAVNRKGEHVDLATADGWRRQRRSFTLEAVRGIREAWELPKANSNGSSTQSPTEAAPLTAATT
jgi:hypothetical protein